MVLDRRSGTPACTATMSRARTKAAASASTASPAVPALMSAGPAPSPAATKDCLAASKAATIFVEAPHEELKRLLFFAL